MSSATQRRFAASPFAFSVTKLYACNNQAADLCEIVKPHENHKLRPPHAKGAKLKAPPPIAHVDQDQRLFFDNSSAMNVA